MALSIPQPLLKIKSLFGGHEREGVRVPNESDTFFYENAGPFGTVELHRDGVGVILKADQVQKLGALPTTKDMYDSQVLPDGRYLITPKPKDKIQK